MPISQYAKDFITTGFKRQTKNLGEIFEKIREIEDDSFPII